MTDREEALKALREIEMLLNSIVDIAKESNFKEDIGVEAIASFKLTEQINTIRKALEDKEPEVVTFNDINTKMLDTVEVVTPLITLCISKILQIIEEYYPNGVIIKGDE